MAIMFTGVTVLGVLAGSLASLFNIETDAEVPARATSEQGSLREELTALRMELRSLDGRLGALADRARTTVEAES